MSLAHAQSVATMVASGEVHTERWDNLLQLAGATHVVARVRPGSTLEHFRESFIWEGAGRPVSVSGARTSRRARCAAACRVGGSPRAGIA
jgi:hypothetical protein